MEIMVTKLPTSTYRITERNNETDELVRVVAMLSAVPFQTAHAMETESIAESGNHIRMEKWNDGQWGIGDEAGWEYL